MKPSQIEPTVRLGKDGVTQGVVEELLQQLKKRKIVKLKLLRPAREAGDVRKMAQELALRTGAEVVDVRGGAIVLALPGTPKS